MEYKSLNRSIEQVDSRLLESLKDANWRRQNAKNAVPDADKDASSDIFPVCKQQASANW